MEMWGMPLGCTVPRGGVAVRPRRAVFRVVDATCNSPHIHARRLMMRHEHDAYVDGKPIVELPDKTEKIERCAPPPPRPHPWARDCSRAQTAQRLSLAGCAFGAQAGGCCRSITHARANGGPVFRVSAGRSPPSHGYYRCSSPG